MIKSKNPSQHITPHTGGTTKSLRRRQTTSRRSHPRDKQYVYVRYIVRISIFLDIQRTAMMSNYALHFV